MSLDRSAPRRVGGGMKTISLAALLLLGLASGAAGQQNDLVPPGWVRLPDRPEQSGPRYASPDGRAVLMGHASPADRPIRAEMDAIAFRDGERVTYQRRTRRFIAVSGYKGTGSSTARATSPATDGAGTTSRSNIRRPTSGRWTASSPASRTA
ncbi:MAG: hypothetical protein M5U07_13845 [Xanthobacteraceae bacterium]|nr:hypothetical protein [Xanthobacteraceae bacterium]